MKCRDGENGMMGGNVLMMKKEGERMEGGWKVGSSAVVFPARTDRLNATQYKMDYKRIYLNID